jgi:NAD(P)H-hydrate epimerase
MTKIVTVAEMKAIEAAADRAGVTYAMMMESAGSAVARAVLERLENPTEHKVVALCGTGNNGGDGMVAAYHLAEAGVGSVALYFSKMPDENDPNLQRVRQSQKGLFVVDAENDQRWRVLKHLLGGVTVLIDAVFGTGVRLPLSGKPAEMLAQARKALEERAVQPLRVAVDCPSGLNCDTGDLDPVALPADVTVTFAAAKRGQFAFPAAEALGELIVAGIGVPEALPELAGVRLSLGTREAVRAVLPPRPRNAHKGTFGRALIAAGSVNFTGAAFLAGAAAYRVGAGLVTLAVPAPLYPILAAQLPEATWIVLPHELGVIAGAAAEVLEKELGRAQALLIGPGFGMDKETASFVRRLLRAEDKTHRGAVGFGARVESAQPAEAGPLPPLVVDADGLRLLAQIEDWPKRLPPNTVLTPHPGEMSALTGMDKDALQADRIGAAQKYAAEWGHVVVLKGAFTVVAAPDGRATVQPFATAALARAGTGDVLAGAIVGLLAQGVPPYEAAVAGSFLHGLAGELAARALGTTASVLASDVLDALPEALMEVI